MEVLEILKNHINDPAEGLRVLDEHYLVKSKILNGKVLLKYHRQSDKSLKIVRECRGLILNAKTFEPVSIMMEKFGNHGESYVPADIDITKCKVVEKCDGTCFGLYYDQINNKWCVQTLGQIEAEETVKGWGREGQFGFSWAELFWKVFSKYADKSILDTIDKDWTYIFELCSTYNKVVVTHNESKLYFLAMRNKRTLQEDWVENHNFYNVFSKPNVYEYKDINEILRLCKEVLTREEEGFVLVDENFRRVKMKGDKYIQEHYESTVITLNSVIQVVFQNEEGEWLSVFPEFKPVIDVIKDEIKNLGKRIDEFYADCMNKLVDKTSRKELAILTKDIKNKGIEKKYIFRLFTGELKSGTDGVIEFDKPEDLPGKVRQFIENSDICKRIDYNIDNNSLK